MEALIQPGHRLNYLLSGNVIVTVVGREKRFTYKIIVPKTRTDARWVHVLGGENNTTDYRFIGGIYQRVRSPDDESHSFLHSPRSRIEKNAPCVAAFAWWFNRHIEDDRAQVFHSGKCGRCGRPLTTPESIQTGLGPVCAERAKTRTLARDVVESLASDTDAINARASRGRPLYLIPAVQAAATAYVSDALDVAEKHHGEFA